MKARGGAFNGGSFTRNDEHVRTFLKEYQEQRNDTELECCKIIEISAIVSLPEISYFNILTKEYLKISGGLLE